MARPVKFRIAVPRIRIVNRPIRIPQVRIPRINLPRDSLRRRARK